MQIYRIKNSASQIDETSKDQEADVDEDYFLIIQRTYQLWCSPYKMLGARLYNSLKNEKGVIDKKW